MQTSQHHIVLRAGAVDDERVSALVFANENAHMGVAGIEHQITRQGFAPGDLLAVAVLTGRTAAVPDDIVQRIVEYPVHK